MDGFGGGLVTWLAYRWAMMVMGKSMVVGSDVRIWWWVGQPVDGFRWMGRRWVGGWVGSGWDVGR